MKDKKHNQPGAQQHAEGEYGDRTRERNREQVQNGAEPRDEHRSEERAPAAGRHRLREDREQYDEADLQSEKNRSAIERERNS